ncbi:MAG: glucosamine-6-phosphate deaminase [Defluviitaleaceae bacterium]|nr:glucosamine-6-phosphate deaminase [Defluviitaleaceae bacterium]MCL2263454.1 glucosamine-6-phosphate deaminase [Defluviitaleaceae bacterium]
MSNVKIFVEKDYAALSRRSAQIIKARLEEKAASVLGLATGSTPIGTYEELVRLFNAGEIDFSQVTAFNLDEYFPVTKENNQSYAYFMRKNLFGFVNVKETNIPNGEAKNHETECAEYEKKIAASGGIDLQILGIGNNGHIGFNEPTDVFPSVTHYVELDASTIKANARFFANESEVPRHAITMGIKTIMQAKKILLLASGAGKANIIRDALFGAITPANPSSVLQLHHDVTVIVDEDAGKFIC